jgi:hypothetical protein
MTAHLASAAGASPLPAAVSNGDVLIIAVVVAIPLALLTFVLGARNALNQIGKGQFAVEFESDLDQRSPAESESGVTSREAEIRQMVEAKAFRQAARGGPAIDVEAEVARLLKRPGGGSGGARGHDAALREEVRQLVIARNERRVRQGREPLDVDAEVERQLRELESLGQ